MRRLIGSSAHRLIGSSAHRLIGSSAHRLTGSSANADVLVEAQGFDTCAAPTTSVMSAWWSDSPFFFVGIYIGGSNESCSQANLNSAWVSSVRGEGWDLLPLWAGRQTSCIGGSGPISTDETSAYDEGVSSADSAYSAALRLGLGAGDPLFVDLEGGGWSTTCEDEAEWYLSGRDAGLNTDGYYKTGVYGSSSGSDLAALASYTGTGTSEAFVGDDAGEYGTTFQDSSSDTDVYGLLDLPNGYWNPNARIRQFWYEDELTYGGTRIEIDQDCADADLAGTDSLQPGC